MSLPYSRNTLNVQRERFIAQSESFQAFELCTAAS
jgi:hypothetical protein